MSQDKDKAKDKDIGQRLKHELEKLKELIPLDTDHDQEVICGTAGCFGAKLVVMYYKNDLDFVYDYSDGANALAKELGFSCRQAMLDYLYHWWPTRGAVCAFEGSYDAYEGYSKDYAGVWQAWMDCADNMIEGRQLR